MRYNFNVTANYGPEMKSRQIDEYNSEQFETGKYTVYCSSSEGSDGVIQTQNIHRVVDTEAEAKAIVTKFLDDNYET